MKQFRPAVMAWHCLVLISMFAIFAIATIPEPSKNCKRTCGNVSVPYPFGLLQDEYGNCSMHGFSLNCHDTGKGGHKLFYNDIELLSISLMQGRARVLNKISSACYSSTSQMVEYTDNLALDFTNSPFRFSDSENKFTVIGCEALSFIRDSDMLGKFMAGCMAMCRHGNVKGMTQGQCNGIGCCQTGIPKGLQYLKIWFDTAYTMNSVNASNCSYAMLMDSSSFIFDISDAVSEQFYNRNGGQTPVVVDWVVGNDTCSEASKKGDSFACISSNSTCLDSLNGPGYTCQCSDGFKGNPYLAHGCIDIDECLEDNICPEICNNTPGSYTCKCRDGGVYDPLKKQCLRHGQSRLAGILIGLGLGLCFVVLCTFAVFLFYKWKNYIQIQKRRKHFSNNLRLLQQQNAGENTKLFSLKELATATDYFNTTRIIGSGGFGTVYKGILRDQRVVAIKKSNKADEAEVNQFVNEVVILSQTSHRNVLKLVGCCLEVEVPLLIYEFMDNGTLYDLLHDHTRKDFLSWSTCLQIATEVAAAIQYLQYAAPISIYHRDMKTHNILMDSNCVAKIADFGISKIIPTNKSYVATTVQGTFAYLDPEYMTTSILTEKSDVYSFGVVLLEFLIRKPSSFRSQSGTMMLLTTYFTEARQQGRLMEIVPKQVQREADLSQIEIFASLAERCVKRKSQERPTIKEIEMVLQKMVKDSPKIKEAHGKSSDHEASLNLEREYLSTATLPR